MEHQRKLVTEWFSSLRDEMCQAFEEIEREFASENDVVPGKFVRKYWDRNAEGDGGGGAMSCMKGNVFEKVGANISEVSGQFSEEFRKKIPGTANNSAFFASGISIIAHMCSPLIPSIHFNTRYIETGRSWFGGVVDITPMYHDETEKKDFHEALGEVCDKHDTEYYAKFSKECSEYFYIKHREEPRGAGGIFYDNLDNDFNMNFSFTKDVGRLALDIFPKIIRKKMHLKWMDDQREHQLIKRGRYVEFNLLYDRGTQFGLSTGGNAEAILISMPPVVKWP